MCKTVFRALLNIPPNAVQRKFRQDPCAITRDSYFVNCGEKTQAIDEATTRTPFLISILEFMVAIDVEIP